MRFIKKWCCARCVFSIRDWSKPISILMRIRRSHVT